MLFIGMYDLFLFRLARYITKRVFKFFRWTSLRYVIETLIIIIIVLFVRLYYP